MSDPDEPKTVETHPKEASIGDIIAGDVDDNGNATERGVVVTETTPVE